MRLIIIVLFAVIAACGCGRSIDSARTPQSTGMNSLPAGSVLVTVEGAQSTGVPYEIMAFTSRFVTVSAAMQTNAGTRPAQNFTGVPLYHLVAASVSTNTPIRLIDVIGRDGYSQAFRANEVLTNETLLLVPTDDDSCNLVAKGQPAFRWVRDVVAISIK